MERLLQELQIVSKACVLGSHEEVCQILGIGERYSRMIRQGKRLTKNTTKNREVLKQIISEYRRILKRERKKLNRLLKSKSRK